MNSNTYLLILNKKDQERQWLPLGFSVRFPRASVPVNSSVIADTAVAAAAVLALLGSGAWAAAPCWRCWAAAPGLRLQSHWLQLTGRDVGRGEEHEREELEEHHRG